MSKLLFSGTGKRSDYPLCHVINVEFVLKWIKHYKMCFAVYVIYHDWVKNVAGIIHINDKSGSSESSGQS